VDSAGPKSKIALRGDDGEIETVWAYELGNGQYKIDNTPWYAYGISWHDVVEAAPDEAGQLCLTRIAVKSGNRTVRILSDEPFTDEWLSKLVALGASYEGANRKYYGVNIPPGIDLGVVANFLISEGVEWEHADPTYDEIHGRTDA
jgi:hypothetical protein